MPTPSKPDNAPSTGAAALDLRSGESTAEVGPIVSEVSDPYIGTVLGERYQIIQKLGAGGMGAVYLAEHVVIERKVAIKILSQDFATKADLVQRFIQEARAAAKIGHENIVEVYDFGETSSGSVFFAMEYLEGRDLASLIQEAGALPATRVRPIAVQICRALAAAHAKKIIHRDLKPENIYLIEKDGRNDFVKILDFGIAKIASVEENGNRLTRAGMIFGTPEYMSPEQARGEIPDHRVDIYALGCILYEMLTGRVPFQAETFMGTLTKHMFEVPELPSRRARLPIPKDLEAICIRAIDKDRDRRFQTMQEFSQALDGEIQVALPQPMPQMPNEQLGWAPGMPMPQANVGMASGVPGQPMGYQQQLQQFQQMQQLQGMYASAMPLQMPNGGANIVAGANQAPPSPVSSIFMGAGAMPGQQGPLITGMNIATMAGYSTTAPPTSYEVPRQPNPAHWRRMVFILMGATLGVAVLSVMLFWPQNSSNLPGRVVPGRTAMLPAARPKVPAPPALQPPAPRPAHLFIKGLPDSRVLLDFKDIGYIQPNGELAFDAPSPGTAEWSVHVKVVKEGYADYATRVILHAGSPMSLLAEQPTMSSTKRHRH